MKYLILLVAFVAAACGGPVTDQEAALEAVSCFEWPQEVRERASHVLPARETSDDLVLAFKDAKTVVVDRAGDCGQVTTTQVVSASALRHLPPGSITLDKGRIFILFMSKVDDEGTRAFIGMVGGTRVIDSSPPGSDT